MTAWQGNGAGTVLVRADDNHIHFTESGQFNTVDGTHLNSANVFVWERLDDGISLSHHRHDQPVFLFILIPCSDNTWSSAKDHVCGDDIYSGELKELPDSFELTWRVLGPKKDERLFYRYVKSLDDKAIEPNQ